MWFVLPFEYLYLIDYRWEIFIEYIKDFGWYFIEDEDVIRLGLLFNRPFSQYYWDNSFKKSKRKHRSIQIIIR